MILSNSQEENKLRHCYYDINIYNSNNRLSIINSLVVNMTTTRNSKNGCNDIKYTPVDINS